MFPSVAKKIFRVFKLFLCSNSETKSLLENLNLKNIDYKNNIKFISSDNEKNIVNLNQDILLQQRFWLAASTHKDEDIFCLNTHLRLKEKFKKLITIIAPRHIERSYKIKILSEKLKLKVQILNRQEKILDDSEIVIINYYGALNSFYKFAKSVFIGKSMLKKFQKNGGQNPIEAAKLRCRIYHGPYVYNFKEIYEVLESNQISKMVENYNELSENLITDLNNPLKVNHQPYDSIKILEQKTFNDTMQLVEDFIFNDVK